MIIVDACRGHVGYAQIAILIVSAAGVLYHRRLKKPEWEQAYGVFDERELLIRSLAAGTTMKIMGIGMYAAAMVIGQRPAAWALEIAVLVGVVVYFAALLIIDKRM